MCAFMCFIPAVIFLTISYFVLLTSHKAEIPGIKKFAKVVAVLLWCIAVLVIVCGIYMAISGECCPVGEFMECPEK